MLNQSNTTYSISNFASFFARNVQYLDLSIQESGLKFVNNDQSNFLKFIEILSPVTIKSGFLWDTLIFKITFGEIKYCGVRKTDSLQLGAIINQRLLNYTKKYLIQIESIITQAVSDAKKLFTSNRYIRHADAQHWFSTYGHLSATSKQKNLMQMLSTEGKNSFEEIKLLISDGYSHIDKINQTFVSKQLSLYKSFFDQVETNSLTQQQRKACVTDEKYNLVLAGAGTGKTSTMIGRAGYLIKAGLASPNEILMLAYAHKAADEMHARIKDKLSINNFTAKTFHSLGLQIIGQVEGVKPSIHEMATNEHLRTKFVENQFQQLLKNEDYQALLIHYFANLLHPYKSQHTFKSLGEYTAYILDNDIRTLQGEQVKSYEECEIANFLYRQGVKYQYEPKYKIDTRGPDYKQYQPDFYLTDYDIYIEHFAVDQNNRTPPFIDQAKYLKGMAWKRDLHQQHQTKLIETYSYYKQQGRLTEVLNDKLTEAGVTYAPLPANLLLTNLNAQGQVSKFSKLIAEILTLFKSVGLTIGELAIKFKSSKDWVRIEATIQLFKPIYKAYQQELQSTNNIDFDDMIIRAIEYVESGRYQSPFLYLLVDEFQDISDNRARLLKALIAQQAHASLFCVGDDWQSIYRFSGSDVSLTKNFEANFGTTATSILDKTFRFNNKIGEVASRFITQNPDQIKKLIQSHTLIDTNTISIIKTNKSEIGLDAALNAISLKTANTTSIFLLGRFSFNQPKNLSVLKKKFSKFKIDFMTVHSSKGKEADYVIVLDLIKGNHGFPSEKTSHPLLELLLPKVESYKFAEERRLFYVALTRARHHVYLITDANKPSSFIRELMEHKYPISTDEFKGDGFQEEIADILCPACTTGFLIARDGPHSNFHGCSNYPICNYTQNACKWCGSGLYAKVNLNICKNTRCDYKEPICPDCGGSLILRKGPHGQFWGCTNYRKDDEFSCNYKEKFIKLKSAQ